MATTIDDWEQFISYAYALRSNLASGGWYYRIESLPNVPLNAQYLPIGGYWAATSHPEVAGTAETQPRIAGGRYTAGVMRPIQWTTSHGTLDVYIAAGADGSGGEGQGGGKLAHDFGINMRRGQFVQLTMAASWAPDLEFVVFRGRVRQFYRRQDGMWVVNVVELPGCLQRRTHELEGALFAGLETSITVGGGLTPAYTAGAATMTLAGSYANLDKPTAQTSYCILVTPTGADPFYLTGTLSGATFTITGRNLFGTTDASCTLGDAVQEVAFFDTHPLETLLILLTSTGDGTNGAWDQAPASWGYGLPIEMVDYEGIEMAIGGSTPGGGAAVGWRIFSDSAQESPGEWIETWLKNAGYVLVFKRGKLSIAYAGAPPMLPGSNRRSILLDDFFINRFEHLAFEWPGEYDAVRVVGPSGVASTAQSATWNWPNLGTATYTLEYAWASTSSWRDHVLGRLRHWCQRTPERIELTVAGLDAAKAGPGDVLEIRTSLISRRDGYPFDGSREPQYWFIALLEADWFAHSTKIVAYLLPEDAAQWWNSRT